MKKLNKVIAVLCSATMILGSAVTAFATTPDTAAGDGNILVFSVETVTLPTSVKIAFNPNGYNVTTGEGEPVTDQIVSLKYGIASTANKDRKITVSFEATGVAGSGTEEVVFVDDIKKAQAKSTENADGADYGEYKIYLAAVASTAAPTKSGGTAFAITDWATDEAVTATKESLADAAFTPASKGEVAFTDDGAAMAYKLDKATWDQKAGADGKIEFSTTQEQMAGKFELKSLGEKGVVGFTFKGAMNPNADWTKASIKALKIQPEYEIEDIDGTEVALGENGGLGQIEVAASAADDYKMVKANGAFSYTFKSAPTGSITAFKVDGTDRMGGVNAGNVTYSNGVLAINSQSSTNWGITSGNHTVTATIGSTNVTLTITN